MAPRGRLVVFVVSCTLLVAVLMYTLSSEQEVKVSNSVQQMALENLGGVAIREDEGRGRAEIVKDEEEGDGESLSESRDIVKRGEFQMRKIDEYCAKYHHDNQLPADKEQRDLLYRHLLYDDKRESLYCFVEKIGCTDMKRLWFLSVGELPLKTANDEWVELKYLEKGIRRASLLNKNLTEAERMRKIRDYYKVMIVRHPLERLVSGYRNKIEPPLDGLSMKFPNFIKREILERYQSLEYQEWLNTGGTYNISVQFTHFIQYFIEKNHQNLNPHLKPMINTCHPCTIRYNFYGNFKTFSQDARLIIDKLGLNPEYYRDKSLHKSGSQTAMLLESYYGQLSVILKKELLISLWSELEFYYSLYESERLSHVRLLGVGDDDDEAM